MASNSPPLVLPAVPSGGGGGSLAANFKIASYNLAGLDGQGNIFLTELCSVEQKMGVILVQEHWLSPEKMDHIKNFDPFFTTFGISGMTEKISTEILKGRPFGGQQFWYTTACWLPPPPC